MSNLTNTPTDGSTPLSLFIQVDSIRGFYVVLDHIHSEHRDKTKSDYVHNLVINNIGDTNGNLYADKLDQLVPYFPGGARPAFDNLFVGSAILPWDGPGNAYREGIANEDFRWRNLTLQKTLWEKFEARYPVIWHHYVNYEGVLDYFDEPDVQSGYEAYLVQSVYNAQPSSAIMWAPAIWRDNALTIPEVDAIARTFKTVKFHARHVGKRGITWLHLQDMMGRDWSGNDLEDVRDWYWQLEAAFNWDSLRVTAELFNPDFTPLDAEDYKRRMDYYDSHGIPVGASWEMRYWYQEHVEIE